MRFLYNLLTYLLLIPYACYWVFRSLKNPSSLKQLGQRFGVGLEACRQTVEVLDHELWSELDLVAFGIDDFAEPRL